MKRVTSVDAFAEAVVDLNRTEVPLDGLAEAKDDLARLAPDRCSGGRLSAL
jgi:hypothetical protein